MTNKSTENSPEFSPSILHNQRGPLRPVASAGQPANSFKSVLPAQLNKLLEDKRALAVVCLFLPPLAVLLKTGFSRKFGLSLILFAFFVFPGIIYAFYVNFLESALNPSDNVYEV